MFKKPITVLTVFLFSAAAAYCSVNAQGTSGAQFLKIVNSPRASALGSAFTAFNDDVNSIAFNPAGIAYLHKSEISLVQNNWIQDISNQYLAFAFPANNGAFGVNIDMLNVSSILRRDVNGVSDGSTFGSSNMSAGLAYALRVEDHMALGFTLKSINETIDTSKATAIAGDIGLLFNTSPDLNFGLSVLNIGSSIKFINEADPLPTTVRAGAMYSPADGLKIGIDAGKANDADANFGGGVEYTIRADDKLVFPLRAGYRSGYQTEDLSGLTAGCGVVFNGVLGIDFAWVPLGILGDSMQFGLTYKFGADNRIVPGTDVKEPVVKKSKPAKKANKPQPKNVKGRPDAVSLAVADFSGRNVSAATAVTISDFVRAELENLNTFKIVEREEMEKLLGADAARATECLVPACAAKMGKMFKVKKIVVGSVSKFTSSYYITIDVVDVETGKLLASFIQDASSVTMLRDACRVCAQKAAQAAK